MYRVLGDRRTGAFAGDPSGITGQQIVRPEAIEVIHPTPGGRAEAAPTGSFLTLTTCHPRYSARQRLIIHAAPRGGRDPEGRRARRPAALSER